MDCFKFKFPYKDRPTPIYLMGFKDSSSSMGIEGVINLSFPTKEYILETVKELLVAYSNLNLQMNKQLERESQRIQKPY